MFELEILERLAREGAAAALALFGQVTPEQKEDGSIVTDADRASQRIIHQRLREIAPDARQLYFCGEENLGDANDGRLDPENSEYVVAVDPVDGTTSFSSGLPLWGVSIGLFHEGELASGVLFMPLIGGPTGSLYAGQRGQPSLLNGVPIRVAAHRPWHRASQIAVPSSVLRHDVLRGFPGKARSLGSVAHHVALVASGKLDAAFVGRSRVWDLAGAASVLAGAGGVLRDADGEEVDWPHLWRGERPQRPLLAGSPAAVETLSAWLGPEE